MSRSASFRLLACCSMALHRSFASAAARSAAAAVSRLVCSSCCMAANWSSFARAPSRLAFTIAASCASALAKDSSAASARRFMAFNSSISLALPPLPLAAGLCCCCCRRASSSCLLACSSSCWSDCTSSAPDCCALRSAICLSLSFSFLRTSRIERWSSSLLLHAIAAGMPLALEALDATDLVGEGGRCAPSSMFTSILCPPSVYNQFCVHAVPYPPSRAMPTGTLFFLTSGRVAALF
mmetsp:Transcript_17238/g.47803  ORF Transcript_17238/g.47803 Transcript_17238/m.47803 type:complete len:238 (+) Transcript_17238:282-995(+)